MKRIAIAAVARENVLILHMVRGEDFKPLKFTLRADPGVSAAIPLDSFGGQPVRR